jgi:hypothetical protein
MRLCRTDPSICTYLATSGGSTRRLYRGGHGSYSIAVEGKVGVCAIFGQQRDSKRVLLEENKKREVFDGQKIMLLEVQIG